MAEPRFIGIAFPFRAGPDGIPLTKTDADIIMDDLFLLLKTNTRTRVMDPKFGVNLLKLVFDNTGPFLKAKIFRLLGEGIGRFERRVRLTNIIVNEVGTTVTIDLDLLVLGSLQSMSLEVDRDNGSVTRVA